MKTSVEKVLKGENAGKVAERDHADWYRALFSPSVTVGLLKAAELAGYRGPLLMNVMLASGGYPWTIIPVERRNAYMDTLEAASVNGNIEPFAKFLGGLVKDNLEGQPGPKVPEK